MMPDLRQDEKSDVEIATENVRNANSAHDSGAAKRPADEQVSLEEPRLVDFAEASVSIETTPSADNQGAHEVEARLERLEASIATGFDRVLKSFEHKLAFDQFKEEQISRLHDELQEYKAGLVIKTVRPLISGIIRFHDDVGRIVEALRNRDVMELTPERFFKVIQGFQQDVEIVLSDNGVEAYTEAGDTFDPHRQKALATVPSTDAALTGRIAARLRPGFEQSGTVLQKERVAVYVLADAAALSSNDDSEDASIRNPTAEGEHK
jgi:molecular chaperone GrpE (heat shock protein)